MICAMQIREFTDFSRMKSSPYEKWRSLCPYESFDMRGCCCPMFEPYPWGQLLLAAKARAHPEDGQDGEESESAEGKVPLEFVGCDGD